MIDDGDGDGGWRVGTRSSVDDDEDDDEDEAVVRRG